MCGERRACGHRLAAFEVLDYGRRFRGDSWRLCDPKCWSAGTFLRRHAAHHFVVCNFEDNILEHPFTLCPSAARSQACWLEGGGSSPPPLCPPPPPRV